MESDNSGQHFFEGAEKLLEIWFDTTHKDVSDDEDDVQSLQNGSSCGDNRTLSLRSIPRHQLDFLVELAHAQIIGNVSNARVDSYVLSESSLFVSDRRLILKTCGTTSLLSALGPLLQMARDYCGLDKVASCNYSRRNFTRPELQPLFHQNFEEEIQILTEILRGGAGYCMGKINQDRWYLFNYTADEPCRGLNVQDQTVEVLMSNLDPEVMKIFTRQISSSAVEARKLSGIDKLMPVGSLIDDKLFDPCGYSLNGLYADKDEYYTIHITPEADYSYVSFETNARRLNYTDLVQQVVDTFKPGTFLVTLYGNQWSNEVRKGQQDLWSTMIRGYNRNDLQLLALPEESVVLYGQYTSKSVAMDKVKERMFAPFDV